MKNSTRRFMLLILALFTLSLCAGAEEYTGVVTASVLNVRKEPSAKSEVVAKLKRNTEVTVLGGKDGWVQIRTGEGQNGFASANYIKNAAVAEEEKGKTSDKTPPPPPPARQISAGEKEFLEKFRLDRKSGREVTITGVFYTVSKNQAPHYALLKTVNSQYRLAYYLELPSSIKTSALQEKNVKVVGVLYSIPGWKTKIIWGRKVTVISE